MTFPALASRPTASPGRLAACAALLLSLPGLATAAEAAGRLEIAWGPNETTAVSLFTIKATLDGQALVLRKPEPGDPPGRPVYEGPLLAGRHQLQVAVTLAGRNPVFSYVEDYHLDLSGLLEFASADRGTVKTVARIRDRSEVLVEWKDRFGLDLSAVRTVPVAPPGSEDDEPELVAATPAPPPGRKPAAAPGGCALDPVRFGLAKATLSQPGQVALDKFAACLARSSAPVKLVGHCDRRGSDATNLRLGEQRAEAAARYLEQLGVAAGRLSVESKGAGEPLCSESTTACFARNRRVDAFVGGAP